MARKIPKKYKKGGKVSKKISLLVKEGYPQKQAVAIALNMKKRKKLQNGGIGGYDWDWSTNPALANVETNWRRPSGNEYRTIHDTPKISGGPPPTLQSRLEKQQIESWEGILNNPASSEAEKVRASEMLNTIIGVTPQETALGEQSALEEGRKIGDEYSKGKLRRKDRRERRASGESSFKLPKTEGKLKGKLKGKGGDIASMGLGLLDTFVGGEQGKKRAQEQKAISEAVEGVTTTGLQGDVDRERAYQTAWAENRPEYGKEGAVSGGIKGAALGTKIAPGVGTVVGGVLGAIAGGLTGKTKGQEANIAEHERRTGVRKGLIGEQQRQIAAIDPTEERNEYASVATVKKGGKVMKTGGTITGPGTGTSDSISGNLNQGDFIADAAHEKDALELRIEFGLSNKKANLKKGGKTTKKIPVKVSNGETLFTREEINTMVKKGGGKVIDYLNSLAPKAEIPLKKGGVTKKQKKETKSYLMGGEIGDKMWKRSHKNMLLRGENTIQDPLQWSLSGKLDSNLKKGGKAVPMQKGGKTYKERLKDLANIKQGRVTAKQIKELEDAIRLQSIKEDAAWYKGDTDKLNKLQSDLEEAQEKYLAQETFAHLNKLDSRINELKADLEAATNTDKAQEIQNEIHSLETDREEVVDIGGHKLAENAALFGGSTVVQGLLGVPGAIAGTLGQAAAVYRSATGDSPSEQIANLDKIKSRTEEVAPTKKEEFLTEPGEGVLAIKPPPTKKPTGTGTKPAKPLTEMEKEAASIPEPMTPLTIEEGLGGPMDIPKEQEEIAEDLYENFQKRQEEKEAVTSTEPESEGIDFNFSDLLALTQAGIGWKGLKASGERPTGEPSTALKEYGEEVDALQPSFEFPIAAAMKQIETERIAGSVALSGDRASERARRTVAMRQAMESKAGLLERKELHESQAEDRFALAKAGMKGQIASQQAREERDLFLDDLGAFKEKQMAYGNLLQTGISNFVQGREARRTRQELLALDRPSNITIQT